MSLGKRSTDAIVGAFVVLGTAAVIGATLWTREARVGGGRTEIAARFRDVGNARIGTGVYIRGVRLGRVAALALEDDGWVHARLALDPAVTLPDRPVVVLGAASLFGEWQATVTSRDAAPDHPDVRRQLDEADGTRGVLPGATLPDVAQLTTVAGRIADDVGAVAGRVRVAFDDSAARELRQTIASSAALSATLAATARRQAGAIDALSTDLRAGARSLARTSDALERTASRADSATAAGDVQRAVRDAAAAAADLRATAASLRTLAARGDATFASLDRAIARADTLVAKANAGRGSLGRLMNDSSLYVGADALVAELRALVADVKANPRKYVNVRVF